MRLVANKGVHAHKVQAYWQTLYMHDLLKYRMCDIVEPTWSDVFAMLCTKGDSVFYMMKDDEIAGEFTLDFLSGKMFAVHFSFHPTLFSTREKVHYGRIACLTTLDNWKTEDGERYVSTIVGLIPVQNRAAIKFAEKVGFVNIGRLPSAQHHLGKLTDAQFLIMSTGEYHGRR